MPDHRHQIHQCRPQHHRHDRSHHHKSVICTSQTLNRNACDINVGDAQAWIVTVGAVEANFSHGGAARQSDPPNFGAIGPLLA